MKLELVNFRTFSKAEFTFDSDYVLISGPSGSGKTSIFMAIHFAMTGEGKKVVKRGKVKCSVKLSFGKDLVITRTKGPCRLLVNYESKEHEDNAAQCVIDRLFRNWDLGYVTQQVYRSFVLMSPADKLFAIEQMAFAECTVEEIQTKCRNLLTERKTALDGIVNQKNAVVSVLRDTVGVADDDDEVVDVDKLRNDLSELQKTRKSTVDKLAVARAERDEMKHCECDLRTAENRLSELHDVDTAVDIKQLVQQNERYKRFVESTRGLDFEMKKSGTEDIDARIDFLRELKRLRSAVDDYPTVDSLKTELHELENFKKSVCVKLGECPSCKVLLGKWNDDLVCIENGGCRSATRNEMDKCVKRIYEISRTLDQLRYYQIKLETLMVGKEPVDDVDAETSKLINVKRNDSLWDLHDSLKCDKPAHDDVDKLIRQLKERDQLLYRIDSLKSRLCKYNPSKLSETESALVHVDEEIKELSERIADVERRKQWKRVKLLEEQEKYYSSKIPSVHKLQCMIKSAERVAIEDTLRNINVRVSIYLSKFAPDVSAELVFEHKKNSVAQPKIEIKITMDYGETDMQSLSGGEMARVMLAFALAMAEMNNVRLLMLDESFASLDEMTTGNVMATIKEHFNGKIIVIAHQTTKGVFDEIIELG